MNCYFPDTSEAVSYSPCDSTAEHTHCCSGGDYCYDNGLCFNTRLMIMYRGGCTDQSWKDPACSNICKKESTVAPLFPCGDLNYDWACHLDDCNNNSSSVFQIPEGKIMENDALDNDLGGTITSDAATATAPTSGARKPTDASTSPSSDLSCPSHAGVMAGIAVGIGVPLLIALATITLFWLRERKRAKPFYAVPAGLDGSADLPEAVKPGAIGGKSRFTSRWMATQPVPVSTATPQSRHSAGVATYPSELPSNSVQISQLDSTARKGGP